MSNTKYIVILLIVLSSCYVKNEEKEVIEKKDKKRELTTKKVLKKESFTVSCGSGCAMTYDELDSKIADSLQTIKFQVTMYVNEVVTEEYFESYELECESGSLQSIKLVGEKENLLENDDLLIRDDLKRIAERICRNR
ncbi:MAG TPA: hypothetical protein VF691_21065 [Cytophagaceae bacterium]|jgi:hypothetical protein